MIAFLILLITPLSTGNQFYLDNKVYLDTTVHSWNVGVPENYDRQFSSLQKDRNFRALLVARKGLLVYEKYNKASSLEARNIHSASKSILSVAVGKAIGNGNLTLTTTVSEALGSKFTVPTNKRSITVRHLLTMTSGISWAEDSTEYRLGSNRIQGILNLGQAATPGTRFNYSTGDATLLAAVLSEKVGSYGPYADNVLLSGLGISVERWGVDPKGYYSGGCNFFITPREMLRFGQYALEHISDPWMVESTKKQVAGQYGYMWWVDVKDGFRAWGWGKNFIYVFPKYNLVIVTAYDTASRVNDGDNYSTISGMVK